MQLRNIRMVATGIEDRSGGVRVLTLEDPEGWELPPFRPGAHIDLYLRKGLVRTYSLVNPPEDDRRYVIAVKREMDGRGGSAFVHEELASGDVVWISLPRGGVPLDAERQTFIAGGIGVTPFVSATRHLLRCGRRDFTLHLITRGASPLSRELAELDLGDTLQVHDTSQGSRPVLAELVGALPRDARIGFCGPDALLAAFEAATRERDPQHLHIERFVPPPVIVDPAARPYRLVLRKSGVAIDVDAGKSMLDALLEHGFDIPWSCCGGICGACRVRWLSGNPIHGDRVLQPEERASTLMACTAYCASEELELDL